MAVVQDNQHAKKKDRLPQRGTEGKTTAGTNRPQKTAPKEAADDPAKLVGPNSQYPK
jgi:hypothetical protein